MQSLLVGQPGASLSTEGRGAGQAVSVLSPCQEGQWLSEPGAWQGPGMLPSPPRVAAHPGVLYQKRGAFICQEKSPAEGSAGKYQLWEARE